MGKSPERLRMGNPEICRVLWMVKPRLSLPREWMETLLRKSLTETRPRNRMEILPINRTENHRKTTSVKQI
jgi:hypothetical protein